MVVAIYAITIVGFYNEPISLGAIDFNRARNWFRKINWSNPNNSVSFIYRK